MAVVDAEDVAAAAFAGVANGAFPAGLGIDRGGVHGPRPTSDERAKLRIRDTNSRMIIAECHRAPGGIVIRVLPGGPVNQQLVARTLAPPVADALIHSGPWVYSVSAPGPGRAAQPRRSAPRLRHVHALDTAQHLRPSRRTDLVVGARRGEPFPTA